MRHLSYNILTIDELKALFNNSTNVESWHAHWPGEVRGPWCRWLQVTEVAPEYEKHVAHKMDDARYATAAMNNLPHLIARIEELEKKVEQYENREFYL